MSRAPALPTLALTAGLLLAGCSSGSTAAPATTALPAAAPSSVVPPPPPPPVTSATTTGPPTTTTAPTTPAGHGQVVVLDPGHNGGNSTHPAEINKLVPAGRGQSKACNTTGTATNAGYPEHAFNWDVAQRVQADLVAKGFQVIMTRPDDAGVGPCVDQRAAAGNAANAAAVVSIHADGAPAADHGFHVEYSAPALNAEQGAPSIALATAVRDAVHSAGFDLSDYLGKQGLYGRPDLGGLNLSTRPTALIECGNMRNATDAATDTSATGRQQYADAIAAGTEAYLAQP